MTAGTEMTVIGGLATRPDPSMVEVSRQELYRIDSDLARKLKDVASLAAPAGMDVAKWQASKAFLEVQAKHDSEKQKLPHTTVIQLYELHQIYEGLVNGGETAPEEPKKNIMLSEAKTSSVHDAETIIAAALHDISRTGVDLSGLLLDIVPPSIQKLSSTLVKLDLANNNLATLPDPVTSLVNLISLDLHSNQMTSLPDSVGRLVNLKVLNVSSNLLATLPEGIEGCRALEELIADFNQLMRLPEALGFELVNLRKLSVHSNRLTRLPYSTTHMMRLRVLDVHLNRLRELPADLENLMDLQILNISKNFNYFVALPDSIGGLTSLLELDISYNQITALPNSIARLENLQRLKVEGNPLVVPPPHVVEHSVTVIKQYLVEQLRESERKREKKGHSWLGNLISGKWGKPRCGSFKYKAKVLSMPEEPMTCARTPLRLFTPGTSSSPFRAFATPLRRQHNSYTNLI